jgi:SdpI/YfhL protein family
VISSYVAFPAIAAVSMLVGWPLATRRVPRNRWYGVRVPATMSDPEIWYDANAVTGLDLFRLGLVLFAVSLGLQVIPGLPELGYVMICLAVLLVGSIRATLRGARLAGRLHQEMIARRLGGGA